MKALVSVPSSQSTASFLFSRHCYSYNSCILPCQISVSRTTHLKQRLSPFITLSSSSSSISSVVEQQKQQQQQEEAEDSSLTSSPPSLVEPVDVEDEADSDAYAASFSGCKACGREQIERGCNGEGRIQGGIATIPGFGWWPIKAYRPCPGFVTSGGNYRRRGQSMDEVAFGGGRGASSSDLDDAEARKKGKDRRKFKR